MDANEQNEQNAHEETYSVIVPGEYYASRPAEDVTVKLHKYLLYHDEWVDVQQMLQQKGGPEWTEADQARLLDIVEQYARRKSVQLAERLNALSAEWSLGIPQVTPEVMYYIILHPEMWTQWLQEGE